MSDERARKATEDEVEGHDWTVEDSTVEDATVEAHDADVEGHSLRMDVVENVVEDVVE